jgi:hypothetical protein
MSCIVAAGAALAGGKEGGVVCAIAWYDHNITHTASHGPPLLVAKLIDGLPFTQ